MIRSSTLTALLLCSLTSHAAPKAEGAPKMNEGESKFATQLYGRLASTPGNLFFSPASIRIAMGMAYAGAKGATAEQMRVTLGLPEGKAAHTQVAAQLARWESFAHPKLSPAATQNSDPSMQKYWEEDLLRRTIRLNSANALFTQRGNPLRADYLATLKGDYNASALPVDFIKATEAARVEINQWVSQRTNKKIPELIAPRLITSATRSVLVNTIYFKAAWMSVFTQGTTKDGPFFATPTEQVRVPLMRQIEHFMISRFAGGAMLELPYGSGNLAMYVILPTAKDGLPAIEKQLAAGSLPTWLSSLKGERVDVTLPRFKITGSFDLGDTLKAMGMPLAFSFPGADFSRVDDTKTLFLSTVVHQAVVEVDEQGTEAAAATAAMMGPGGMPSEPTVFRADHPFIFLIRDAETGAILFLGRLSRPVAK